ncbi:hypothetical protein T281_12100 [Rhodomicrobium udaipurense JA643]|uniref:Uncharacterized protein n=1 Tax=Rhodomicrobium udaipurense TaxID=1202716 RepID=A0A8I1KLT1_9HYPH|nr:hypothetical protein [Rhodomicrobium udaipurense]KAI94249.1 hypothetical protein T281_12100 [Rhodomicrobium udaipurense JA643]MBJ7544018.1 hypothetical protein [Rhodomicrobium udaipurense]
MTTKIDGVQLFKNIAQHAELFRPIEKDIITSASALVGKFLKQKNLDVEALRSLRAAITADVLLLTIDGLNERDVRTLTKKVDKHYPDLTEASASTLRAHLSDLASSAKDIHAKPEKAGSPKKSTNAGKGKSAKKLKDEAAASWPTSMEATPGRRRK